jgi:hypothetical protein
LNFVQFCGHFVFPITKLLQSVQPSSHYNWLFAVCYVQKLSTQNNFFFLNEIFSVSICLTCITSPLTLPVCISDHKHVLILLNIFTKFENNYVYPRTKRGNLQFIFCQILTSSIFTLNTLSKPLSNQFTHRCTINFKYMKQQDIDNTCNSNMPTLQSNTKYTNSRTLKYYIKYLEKREISVHMIHNILQVNDTELEKCFDSIIDHEISKQ